MTKDLPLETKILLLFFKYLQKIFFGYSIIQFPFSIFPLIFCSNLKLKFLVFSKFSIIFFYYLH
jgi:hypothetical protein